MSASGRAEPLAADDAARRVIAAALEKLQASSGRGAPATPTWRFSGRWWLDTPLRRRARP